MCKILRPSIRKQQFVNSSSHRPFTKIKPKNMLKHLTSLLTSSLILLIHLYIQIATNYHISNLFRLLYNLSQLQHIELLQINPKNTLKCLVSNCDQNMNIISLWQRWTKHEYRKPLTIHVFMTNAVAVRGTQK